MTTNTVKLLYYRGAGYGYMAGVKEYVVIIDTDVSPKYIEENCCPRFNHLATFDVDGDTKLLPVNVILAPRE